MGLIAKAILLAALLLLGWGAPLHAAEPVEVVVEGVEEEALANVEAVLALPYGLVREGTVDRDWLERFAGQAEAKVRGALEPFGYYNARVRTRLEQPGKGEYRLVVTVEPGEPVQVTEAEVAVRGPGAGEEPLKELVERFPLHRGDVLLQKEYEEAKGALKAKALALGYLDADFARHEIRISADRTAARIGLVLETGPRYLFGETTLEGAPQYPERFLRRYLAYRPGEPFSYARLGESQLNFMNSDRFSRVLLTPEKEGARENRVPVTAHLTPSPRRRLRPGVGYGTDTGARGTLSYRDLNLFHRGHEFHAELYLAERLQGIAAGYLIPSYRDLRSSTGLQLTLQRQDVTTYTSRLISLELDRNRSFGPDRLGTAYVKFLQESFTVGTQDSSSRLILPGLRFSERRYDDLVRPTRGHRYGLEVRGTHQVLGSEVGMIQILANANAIVPLPWRLSLLTRVNGALSFLNDPLAELPASLRFFAGGDRSVRGYSYQSLGPRDASGQVVGGRHLFVGSIELERALFSKWGVSLFYDAGNAFNSLTAIRLYQGAGVGLHYYTVVGGINLYLARQIGVDNPAFHIHLTIGFEL